jgi:hypothetical protein
MRLKTLPEEDRFHFLHPDGRANKAVGLMEYSVPLLTAHIGDISIFPMAFQFAALRVKDQLTMFNQRVVFLQRQFERSFDASLSNENHETVRSNLEQGYCELADSAQFIADLVCDIPKQTRKSPARQRKR